MIIRLLLRGLLTLPLFFLVSALAGVYALRTTVLAPEFITGQLAAVRLYDHLYDEVVDAVLRGDGQRDAEAVEPSAVVMLEAGRGPVTTYLTGKIEGFVTDLYRWLEVAEAPAPVFDLTDLGRVSQPIEAELTRRDTLTPRMQELLRLIISRAVPEEPFTLSSLWDDDPDQLHEIEQVRAAIRQVPAATWLLVAAVGVNALLILLLGSGFGSRLRGLGVALLPAAAAVSVLGMLLSVSFDGWIAMVSPVWPPAEVTMSAGLAQASVALGGGIVGGLGEQLLWAAGITFGVAVGLIVGGLAVRL